MVCRQGMSRLAPARFQGRTRGEPLQTIAMIGASTRARTCLPVMGNANMPHLSVQVPVEQPAIGHRPTPDPRAYCDIEKGIKALGGSPALLSERRSVHISVERDREAQSTAEPPHQVSVGPAW